jgi:Methane oxygenase PmoA
VRSSALTLLFALPVMGQGTLPVVPLLAPVPAVQVLPLPHGISSFLYEGKELTANHHVAADNRPFWYPLMTSQGVSLVRMGHPHDPVTHSHHNGVWIAHNDVNGIDFWGDSPKIRGIIKTVRVDRYEDGDSSAWMLMTNHWMSVDTSEVQLIETRRSEVVPLRGSSSWLLLIDLEFSAPKGKTSVIGKSFFGPVAVRMAKSIGVHDGGGRILNSAGQINEKEVFRQPAHWCDYSGRIRNQDDGFAGITLMNHPSNPTSPTPFHVRDDGWMGASVSADNPVEVTADHPLRLRYALWVHDGLATQAECEAQWQNFGQRAPGSMKRKD